MPDNIVTDSPSEIPEDLKIKLSAIKSVRSLFDILNRGSFEGFLSERVLAGIKFIEALEAQMTKEARQHEFAYLVEELKEELTK